MKAWEKLPEGLAELGVEVDFFWCWVARRDDKIVAMLLGGPQHNAVFFSRIKALPEAGQWWIRGVVRSCARECMRRGYTALFTMVDNGETGQQLREFLTRGNGATAVPFEGFCVAAKLEEFA